MKNTNELKTSHKQEINDMSGSQCNIKINKEQYGTNTKKNKERTLQTDKTSEQG